jgi:hypothetical protein
VFCIAIGDTRNLGKLFVKGILVMTPKACVPIADFRCHNLVLLVSYWNNLNLNSGIQRSLDHGLVCCTHPYTLYGQILIHSVLTNCLEP